MSKSLRIATKNRAETLRLGRIIGRSLKPGSIIALYGELGAGKTVIAQGIGAHFRIRSMRSPTFVVTMKHTLKRREIKSLYHLDLYRLHHLNEIDDEAVKEALQDKLAVTIVEWADRLRKIPKKTIRIRIVVKKNNQRLFVFSGSLPPGLKSLA